MCVETSGPDRTVLAKSRSTLIAMLMCLSCGAVAASPEQGAATQLPRLLEEQGWQHQSDAAGNVYFHPPQPVNVSDHSRETTGPAVGRVDIEQLLLERGWRIETNTQGDTLLLPVSPPAPADIDQMLRERGWRILRDVDGNTLLMPTSSTAMAPSAPSTPKQTSQAAPASVDMDQPDTSGPTAQFQQALQEKGWIVRTESDGSMVIYPPASSTRTPAPREDHAVTGYGYCEGITLVGEESQRPIDTEEKAKLLAGAWIAHFGQATHAVGKARQVNQVFVVSIVESAPPHTLRNLLVIRENGSIVALY
jgi:hypothetical protein